MKKNKIREKASSKYEASLIWKIRAIALNKELPTITAAIASKSGFFEWPLRVKDTMRKTIASFKTTMRTDKTSISLLLPILIFFAPFTHESVNT